MWKWVAFSLGSALLIWWGGLHVAVNDSFFRILFAIAISVAGYEALLERWRIAWPMAVFAVAIMAKAMVAGVHQNAPIILWEGREHWAFYAMFFFGVAAFSAVRHLPSLAFFGALIGLTFGAMALFGSLLFLEVTAEVFALLAALVVLIDPEGRHAARLVGPRLGLGYLGRATYKAGLDRGPSDAGQGP